MRKFFVFVLIVFAVSLSIFAVANLGEAEDLAYQVGSLLPGLLCLILAQWLRSAEKPPKIRLWKPVSVGVLLVLLPLAFQFLFYPFWFGEDSSTAWQWRSKDGGIGIDFPSADWRLLGKHVGNETRFQNIKHRALFGVKAQAESKAEFEKAVKQTHALIRENLEELPILSEHTSGTTPAGNPFALWVMKAKRDRGGFVFLALARVWCRDKEVSAIAQLEAPLTMSARTGRKYEWDYFNKAVRDTCMSAK